MDKVVQVDLDRPSILLSSYTPSFLSKPKSF